MYIVLCAVYTHFHLATYNLHNLKRWQIQERNVEDSFDIFKKLVKLCSLLFKVFNTIAIYFHTRRYVVDIAKDCNIDNYSCLYIPLYWKIKKCEFINHPIFVRCPIASRRQIIYVQTKFITHSGQALVLVVVISTSNALSNRRN